MVEIEGSSLMEEKVLKAAALLSGSKYTVAFTGAGISVESGIPPFRGEKGIWNKYDPTFLEIGHFYNDPVSSWQVIKEIFYQYFGTTRFNDAHKALAVLEERGILQCVITQNIDNLHQEAGSKVVHEFHGNMKEVLCIDCGKKFPVAEIGLEHLPPWCPLCYGLTKPDFVFFGEGIPPDAYEASVEAARRCEVMLVIGTTGEVMPANYIPVIAKQNGAVIIEINTAESLLTTSITDIFLQGRATSVMNQLMDIIDVHDDQKHT